MSFSALSEWSVSIWNRLFTLERFRVIQWYGSESYWRRSENNRFVRMALSVWCPGFKFVNSGQTEIWAVNLSSQHWKIHFWNVVSEFFTITFKKSNKRGPKRRENSVFGDAHEKDFTFLESVSRSGDASHTTRALHSSALITVSGFHLYTSSLTLYTASDVLEVSLTLVLMLTYITTPPLIFTPPSHHPKW
jgi:hypothetical protein